MSSRRRERRLRNLAVWRIGNAALMPFDNGRGELASKTVTIPQVSKLRFSRRHLQKVRQLKPEAQAKL